MVWLPCFALARLSGHSNPQNYIDTLHKGHADVYAEYTLNVHVDMQHIHYEFCCNAFEMMLTDNALQDSSCLPV